VKSGTMECNFLNNEELKARLGKFKRKNQQGWKNNIHSE
jgi:hypothetical protein